MKKQVINFRSIVLLLVAIVSCTYGVAQTQTSDTNYKTTLEATITKIETLFNIVVDDDRGLLKGKEITYGDWRIQQGNLEVSLSNVLTLFDLMYYKQPNGAYRIRKFEHYKTSVDKAAERLNFLSESYTNVEDWNLRKADLKECMLASFGVTKVPKAPNSKPIKTRKRKYKGYSVENIAIEILPGVYTTGSIYKPYPLRKKAAVVLTPNGHFGNGRYRESEQIRCAMLAKMGAIVVNYDLLAWGESQLQFASKYHRNSIAASVQVLSGMRLLDYISTFKYSDMSRVGVTGGSGGGSHTMFMAALDNRIKVSVPVVMVSSHFSGGCPCESGRGIHLCGSGTNNAEVAAMAAPNPQLIISDGGDWTSLVPELEFPFIERTYGLYNAKINVKNAHFGDEGHDYGVSKRMAMYPFMAEHLKLNIKAVTINGKIDESTCAIEITEQLLVFGDKGEKLPKNALKDIDALYQLFGEENKREYETKK